MSRGNTYRSPERIAAESAKIQAGELARIIDRAVRKPFDYHCVKCGDNRGPHIVHGFILPRLGGCGDLPHQAVFCTRCDIWWQERLAATRDRG